MVWRGVAWSSSRVYPFNPLNPSLQCYQTHEGYLDLHDGLDLVTDADELDSSYHVGHLYNDKVKKEPHVPMIHHQ